MSMENIKPDISCARRYGGAEVIINNSDIKYLLTILIHGEVPEGDIIYAIELGLCNSCRHAHGIEYKSECKHKGILYEEERGNDMMGGIKSSLLDLIEEKLGEKKRKEAERELNNGFASWLENLQKSEKSI